MRASASGRHGDSKDPLAIDGDLLALAPTDSGWPHLLLEVGGLKKSVRASIAEMTATPLPAGFVPIVVRLVDARRKRWRWHLDSDDAYDTLGELLAALTAP